MTTEDLVREPDARLRPRGSNHAGMRQFNERVVLQAIRLHGALPGAEIARLTHLTAQTISLITKRLLDDGLLLRGEPQRGKVGQPSVPLSLHPDGAYSVGIKIGRRSMDVLLIDFTGAVRERSSLEYWFPDPDELLAEIGRRLAALRRKLGAERRDLVQGVGIAAPMAIGGWQQATYVAGEVKDPGRVLPLGIISGVILVVGLYLLVNWGALSVLGAPGPLMLMRHFESNEPPPAWWAHRQGCRASTCSCRSMRRAACRRWRSSATSSSRPAATAR